MALNSPKEVFETSLRKFYYSKQEGLGVLRRLVDETTDPNSVQALKGHVTSTERHVSVLEQILGSLELEAKGTKSKGVDSLTDECLALLKDVEDEQTKNLLVNETVLKTEHVEVAVAQGLVAQSTLLNRPDVTQSLNEILADDQNAVSLATTAANSLGSQLQGQQ